MDYQFIYFAMLKLLRERGITQKKLSEKLKSRGINGASEGNLSRGKPIYKHKKKIWQRGTLADGQLRELTKAMEAILLECGIETRQENGAMTWYDVKNQQSLHIPLLQYESDAHAQTDEENAEQTEAQPSEKTAQKLRLLQTAFPHDSALVRAIADHLEKGGSVEILVINLNSQMIQQ